MIKNIFKKIGFSLLITSFTLGCARTVTQKLDTKIIRLKFKVNGQIKSTPDLTYYVVFYAPKVDNTEGSFDPSKGPRINGADIKLGTSVYEGRVPFTGQFPSDIKSDWTDFFYITGGIDRTLKVGKGIKDASDRISISTKDYINSNTMKIGDNTFQLEFNLSDLNNSQALKLKNISCNIGVSNSIENGNGSIFDYWVGNAPFLINLEQNNSFNLVKTQTPVMKKNLDVPDPVLPSGISMDDVNLTNIEINITKLGS